MTADNQPWRGDPQDIVVTRDRDPLALIRLLAELLPDWQSDALCAGERVDWWFPRLGERNTVALEFCGRCPVRQQCLDDARADPALDYGIRGGMSPAARKARRQALRATP